MGKSYVLAIDQGTTGSRAFIVNQQGKVVAQAYKEFKQYYPQAGWVEHDADEIWESCCIVIKQVLRQSGINPQDILSIGITNQRETTLLWDRKTAQPVGKAICWQCRRTAALCQRPGLQSAKSAIRHKTGLVLDPYFSATKIQWLLENNAGLRTRCRQGQVCFGTMDSWLIWKLTGGRAHVTDKTNASRTLLFNIRRQEWDVELLKLFQVPTKILPTVQSSGSQFGTTGARSGAGLPAGIPIQAVLGDQQAALYGQGCFTPGTIKNTYGTGCFMVMNTGKECIMSKHGLLTTLASDAKGRPVYAMEGSVFMAGALVQWLRDQLGIFQKASDSEHLASLVTDTQGVVVVPAFTGLGAPYWDSQARGLITGLTRGADKRHITRAALESIAYQTADIFEVMREVSPGRLKVLRVDGGACANNFLMQFQSDILGVPLIRPRAIESTVQGVAQLAGVVAGLWSPTKGASCNHQQDQIFKPHMSSTQRQVLLQNWHQAVKQARHI